jgi:hypothetical protein
MGWNHADKALSAKVAAHTRWLRDSAGETVAIVGKTLFRRPDGHTFEASYDGQRRTSLKPCARKQYARALAQGYSPDVDLIY